MAPPVCRVCSAPADQACSGCGYTVCDSHEGDRACPVCGDELEDI